jgi:hypothetical protein
MKRKAALVDLDDLNVQHLLQKLKAGKQIGYGSQGRIFELRGQPDKVVKIFNLQTFYDAVDHLRAMIGKVPSCFAQIYSVHTSGKPNKGHVIAAVVMERLYPLETRDYKILGNMMEEDMISSLSACSVGKQEPWHSKRQALTPDQRRIFNLVRALMLKVDAAGYEYHDFHEDQVMQNREGKWKLIEPETNAQPKWNYRTLVARLRRLAGVI